MPTVSPAQMESTKTEFCDSKVGSPTMLGPNEIRTEYFIGDAVMVAAAQTSTTVSRGTQTGHHWHGEAA